MRTLADLIHELDSEAPKFFSLAIVVGFEHTTTFVFGHDPGRLQRLTDAVKQGGEPVGMVGALKEHDTLTLCRKAFDEYTNDPSVPRYLDALLESFAAQLGGSNFTKSEWIN